MSATTSHLFDLTGRVALVTGGSRGIGYMIAEGFIAHGASVYIASRDIASCQRASTALSRGDGMCVPLAADLATLGGVRALAEAFRAREETLDILVNNAGAARIRSFPEFSEEDWDSVLSLNLKAPFFLSQALIEPLRAAAAKNGPAKIINIASVDGIRINARETYSYGASKAGLIHLTAQLAAQLIRHGVVVSAIAPGAFASDMNLAARDDGDRLARRVPAGRIGRPGDIAGAAIYLASHAGDYVVGQTITVDGGFAHALPTHGHPLTGAPSTNS